jgi:hypothetical protein
MSTPVYFLTLGLFFGSIVVVFAMRYLSGYQQAKARIAHEQSYRGIAEKAVAQQADSAEALAAIRSTTSQIEARLTTIEKVLKEVE